MVMENATNTEAKFKYKFGKFRPKTGVIQVLATDYDTYALLYACNIKKNILNNAHKHEFVWVLTRKAFKINDASDLIEFKTIESKVKKILASHIPHYKFYWLEPPVMQGGENGCKYPPADNKWQLKFKDRVFGLKNTSDELTVANLNLTERKVYQLSGLPE